MQYQWILSGKRKEGIKLSSPPKLVEKLVWVLVISFCKISLAVTHLMPYQAVLTPKSPDFRDNFNVLAMFKYMLPTHSTRFPCSPHSDPFDTLSLLSSCMGSVASLRLLDTNFAYRLVQFLWCLEECRVKLPWVGYSQNQGPRTMIVNPTLDFEKLPCR